MKLPITFIFALFVMGFSGVDFIAGEMDWEKLLAAAIGWLCCAAQLKLNGSLK